jgi:hypothetical protein
MTRILITTAVLVVLCSTLSSAADIFASPMARLAVLTFGSQSEKRMTPRPGVTEAACAGENVRCDNPGDKPCCPPMFCDHPTGSTGICRYR